MRNLELIEGICLPCCGLLNDPRCLTVDVDTGMVWTADRNGLFSLTTGDKARTGSFGKPRAYTKRGHLTCIFFAFTVYSCSICSHCPLHVGVLPYCLNHGFRTSRPWCSVCCCAVHSWHRNHLHSSVHWRSVDIQLSHKWGVWVQVSI